MLDLRLLYFRQLLQRLGRVGRQALRVQAGKVVQRLL